MSTILTADLRGSNHQNPMEMGTFAAVSQTCDKARESLSCLKEKWLEHTRVKFDDPNELAKSWQNLHRVSFTCLLSAVQFKEALTHWPKTSGLQSRQVEHRLPIHLDSAAIQACNDTLAKLTDLKDKLAQSDLNAPLSTNTLTKLTSFGKKIAHPVQAIKTGLSIELRESVLVYQNAWLDLKHKIMCKNAIQHLLAARTAETASSASKLSIALSMTEHSPDDLLKSEKGIADSAAEQLEST